MNHGSENYKIIHLHDGTPVKVDPEDHNRLSQYKWSKTGGGYARTGPNSRLMHRMIIGTPPDMVTDHINGDIYDNRKSNLRICTPSENGKNHNRVQVHKDKRYGTWTAKIKVEYECLSLGTYATRAQAVAAYRSAAAYYFGEFARVKAEPKSAEQLLYESRTARDPSFKGVRRFGNRYQARLSIGGKCQNVGMFGSAKEAAQAYDRAARKVGRPEWSLNFPKDLP